jgi:hypothetical protein
LILPFEKATLINSKTVFISTLIVVPTVILLVYASGLENHRSFYLNTLVSTTILSLIFFGVISFGLYNGWKLKDTLGDLTKKTEIGKMPNTSAFDGTSIDFIDEGCGEPVVIILLWVLAAFFGSFLLWLAGGALWSTILVLAAILYWIIFRAFRLIFKNSPKCRGNILRSIITAFSYTVLYNFWIYLIVIGAHYLGS